MTDNNAAKALDDILTAYCMLLGMDPSIPDPLSQTAEQVKLIRTKLAKSAKVDGLLEALEAAKSFINNGIDLGYIRMPDIPEDAAWLVLPMIDKAIQRFNGEG